jgi:inosine-uridine nucleoside N-ribohydrolase
VFHSSKLLRIGLIAISIIAVAIGFTLWSWSFTTSRLTSARSIGVFSSPSEGMLTLINSRWTGIREARIVHAVPETALGDHVWYVIACVWAESRADGSPAGSTTRDFDAPGSYFVDTKEGWVLMPESSLPLFVGFWMRIFGLAGDDRAEPYHDPSGCVRTEYPPLEPITPHAVAANAQPVVIDTDMAADDWLAILYLLGRSDVDVQAITVTGTGEAHCSAGTRNARNLVALAGRPEIPVACGREAPLQGDHAFPTQWRQRVDDLLGLTLPENRREASGESADELLTRIIQGSPQKVHLITLGPLTNVGEVLEVEPGLVKNLEMITVMGGAVAVAGNVGSSSNIENELSGWNFYVDPRAAAEVFGSGAPITLVPLDATNYAPVTMEFYSRLERDRTTSVAEFVYRVLAAQEEYVRLGSYYFWDPLAAAIATEEGLGTFQEISLIVVEEVGAESGRTLESEGGIIMRVAKKADRDRFEALFLDAVNGRLP